MAEGPIYNYTSDVTIGQCVILDGDASLVARVTGLLFRSRGQQVEVSWIQQGTLQSAYVDSWRLTSAPTGGR